MYFCKEIIAALSFFSAFLSYIFYCGWSRPWCNGRGSIWSIYGNQFYIPFLIPWIFLLWFEVLTWTYLWNHWVLSPLYWSKNGKVWLQSDGNQVKNSYARKCCIEWLQHFLSIVHAIMFIIEYWECTYLLLLMSHQNKVCNWGCWCLVYEW